MVLLLLLLASFFFERFCVHSLTFIHFLHACISLSLSPPRLASSLFLSKAVCGLCLALIRNHSHRALFVTKTTSLCLISLRWMVQCPSLCLSRYWNRSLTLFFFCLLANAYPTLLDTYVPLECKKGDMVVLHGHLVHLSKENTSPNSRHAYTFRTLSPSPPSLVSFIIEFAFLDMMSAASKYSEDNWLQRPATAPFQPL